MLRDDLNLQERARDIRDMLTSSLPRSNCPYHVNPDEARIEAGLTGRDLHVSADVGPAGLMSPRRGSSSHPFTTLSTDALTYSAHEKATSSIYEDDTDWNRQRKIR